MASTNFGAMQPDAKVAWVKEAIKVFREESYFTKFSGTGDKSVVQEVRELSKDNKGAAKARVGLVQDLVGTGVSGSNFLEGNEESMDSSWIDINYDQLRNATVSDGALAEQKQVFDFRMQAKDKLAAWAAKIFDEMMVLTASGVSYDYNTDGSLRTVLPGHQSLTSLEFAADVSAPSANRHFNFDGSNLVPGDTTTVTPAFVPTYSMLLKLKALAQVRGIKPLSLGGKAMYILMVHPFTFAKLKEDPDFRSNFIQGAPRSDSNMVFTGADGVTVDGIIIHSNQRAFNTLGAANGQKWGAAGDVNGSASLLLGAQSLASVNIHGGFKWEEKLFDYNDKGGISIGMMVGMRKPKFKSLRDGGSVEDFGLFRINTAI